MSPDLKYSRILNSSPEIPDGRHHSSAASSVISSNYLLVSSANLCDRAEYTKQSRGIKPPYIIDHGDFDQTATMQSCQRAYLKLPNANRLFISHGSLHRLAVKTISSSLRAFLSDLGLSRHSEGYGFVYLCYVYEGKNFTAVDVHRTTNHGVGVTKESKRHIS